MILGKCCVNVGTQQYMIAIQGIIPTLMIQCLITQKCRFFIFLKNNGFGDARIPPDSDDMQASVS